MTIFEVKGELFVRRGFHVPLGLSRAIGPRTRLQGLVLSNKLWVCVGVRQCRERSGKRRLDLRMSRELVYELCPQNEGLYTLQCMYLEYSTSIYQGHLVPSRQGW